MADRTKPLTERMVKLLSALAESGATLEVLPPLFITATDIGNNYRVRSDARPKGDYRPGGFNIATATVDACLNRGYLVRDPGYATTHYRLNGLGRDALATHRSSTHD